MGDRDPVAFRHEGEPAHARRRCKGFYAAGGIARAHILAARPRDRSVVPRGERIDPFAFFIRDFLDSAIGRDRDHAAIIAAGDEFVPRRDGNKNGSIGMRRDSLFGLGRGEQHGTVFERKRWNLSKETRRRDRRAAVERRDIGG